MNLPETLFLEAEGPLRYYYAMGIRRHFGMDFDPLTGTLWATENGPAAGDEINMVEPGFNSGWAQIQGFAGSDILNRGKSAKDLVILGNANTVTLNFLGILLLE